MTVKEEKIETVEKEPLLECTHTQVGFLNYFYFFKQLYNNTHTLSNTYYTDTNTTVHTCTNTQT